MIIDKENFMDRRAFLRLVATAGAVSGAGALLAACNANERSSGATTTAATAPGGTLYVLQDSATNTFDPAKSQSLAITSLALVHRRLTSWDIRPGVTATVVPDLATDTGTPSDGGATWTFTLKDGLRFSDGSPITSADVKWGVERSFSPAFSQGLTYHKSLLVGGGDYRGPFEGQELSSIETPDEKTIVFRLARPYGDWTWIASTPAFAPVPRNTGAEANYGEHPVGSGPYQVQSYQQGVGATLVRNPNWDKATDQVRTGLPDQVVFQFSQDRTVISQRLAADSGDDRFAFGASFVAAATLAQLEGNPAVKQRVVTSDAGALAMLVMNTQKGPLADPAVRTAFQYAVDRSAFQVAAAGSAALAGEVATTLITPGIAGRETYDLYPTQPAGDPEKAKQMLAAAGHPDGLPGLSLLVSTSNGGADRAQAVGAALARAGIQVSIRPLDSDAFTAEVTGAQANYDLAYFSWQPDFPSPNGNIQPLFASGEIGNGGYNISRYSNAEVDALIADAQATVDPVEAGRKWAAVDRRIMQDSPVVPLIYTRNSFLRGSKVGDFFVAAFPAYPNYLKVGITP
ncbi:ABC transporter substrate-binding protein [Pseudonocardia xinjiangensis]|uniref:ABC transporter substrate-binding protein n=1 Tax=Pseudonocardia xinjiangensis TaxID=75289 RepID=UPI003D8F8BCC